MNTEEMVSDFFAQRYHVIRQLGAGGMGVVFEAEDSLLKKRVAIKTIKKGLFSIEHIVRFQREATVLANLNHPNLVPVFVFGLTEDNEPYIVMNYEKGKSLAELIEGRGHFPLYKSLNIFIQICDAMQHAHEQNVLHRDLKPGNIIVRDTENENPSIVVIDFGLAMIPSGNAIDSITKSGVLVGTPNCMSPEQIRGHELDRRSDVYAMGCLMFETLSGKPPFAASSTLEMLSMKLTQTPPRLNSSGPELDLPSGISEIVSKALAPSPSNRYQSMFDLKMDLIAFKSGEYKPAILAAPKEIVQEPTKKRRSAILSLAMIFALCGLTIVPFIVFFNNAAEPPKKLGVTESAKLAQQRSNETLDLTLDALLKRGRKDEVINGVFYTNNSYDDKKVAGFLNGYLGTVRGVSLIGGNVSGVCFEKVRNLEQVNVITTRNANVTDEGLKVLAKLPNLNELQLMDEVRVSPKGLLQLAKVPHLEIVGFNGIGLTEEHLDALVKLPSLNYLLVAYSPLITDAHIDKIASISKLYRVNLSGTKVTDEGLGRLLKAHPNMQLLSVNKLDLTDEGADHISKLTQLRRLDIKNNRRITDKGLRKLETLKNLKELFIDNSVGTEHGRIALQHSLPKTVIKMSFGVREAADELSKIKIGN